MVKVGEKKYVDRITILGMEEEIIIADDDGYIVDSLFRPDVQKLAAELMEWLADTAPEEADK